MCGVLDLDLLSGSLAHVGREHDSKVGASSQHNLVGWNFLRALEDEGDIREVLRYQSKRTYLVAYE